MGFSFGGTVAGVVLRSQDIELLALQGKKPVARVRVPLEGPDAGHLGGALQQALQAAALKTRKLAVSIPSQDVLLRFFTIPAVPKPEWDSVVQFEARKYIPFRTDQLVWDYHIVTSGTAGRLDVIFAAISRELFQKIQDACAQAGVQASLIEPRGLSLARLLEPAKGKDAHVFTCVVDVEEDSGHLAIVKDCVPYLTRNINLLSARAGSAEQPEPQPPQGLGAELSPGETLDPRAHRLLSELSVSMDFFMREYPSTTIPRVILFGEEGVVEPWCRWLADQLHCQVELGSALVERRVQGGMPLAFASAVGLLQAKQDAGAAVLNFLRRASAKPTPAGRAPAKASLELTPDNLVALLKSPQAVMGAVIGACVLALAWFGSALLVNAERQQMRQIVQAAPDVGWGLHQLSQPELDTLNQTVSAQLALLKQLLDQRVRVASKFDALARSLPDGVWITGFIYDDPLDVSGRNQPHIALSGACFLGNPTEELGAIQQFEEDMKRNPVFFSGFDSVQLGLVQANTQDQYTYRTFELTCSTGRRL